MREKIFSNPIFISRILSFVNEKNYANKAIKYGYICGGFYETVTEYYFYPDFYTISSSKIELIKQIPWLAKIIKRNYKIKERITIETRLLQKYLTSMFSAKKEPSISKNRTTFETVMTYSDGNSTHSVRLKPTDMHPITVRTFDHCFRRIRTVTVMRPSTMTSTMLIETINNHIKIFCNFVFNAKRSYIARAEEFLKCRINEPANKEEQKENKYRKWLVRMSKI